MNPYIVDDEEEQQKEQNPKEKQKRDFSNLITNGLLIAILFLILRGNNNPGPTPNPTPDPTPQPTPNQKIPKGSWLVVLDQTESRTTEQIKVLTDLSWRKSWEKNNKYAKYDVDQQKDEPNVKAYVELAPQPPSYLILSPGGKVLDKGQINASFPDKIKKLVQQQEPD
ncbi:MAG: hypothetical protein KatS3mg087_1388 [Patescibacteria group bacterium]|nr:MAG: hypothetical protein KatS3mg087_1388 [Patescibacteria group bacterium]